MYNPNENNSPNPPPLAQNYGAAYSQGTYNYGDKINNTYDIPQPNYNKDYYNQGPPGGNGILYDEFSLNEFSSTKIRHGFIKKVYSILSVQLLLTFGFSIVAVLYKPVNNFIVNNYILFFILGMVLSFPVMIALVCRPQLGRRYPGNYIILFSITLGMAFIVALASATTKSEIFFYAFGTTAVVVIGLTIFAFQTKWDFTGWHVFLYMAFLILSVLGIIGIFVRSNIYNLVFAGIGAFILSISIIVDTQLIIGGKHKKYEFSIDDYIFATLSLYMDIINLFHTMLILYNSD